MGCGSVHIINMPLYHNRYIILRLPKALLTSGPYHSGHPHLTSLEPPHAAFPRRIVPTRRKRRLQAHSRDN